ncbi:MAG: class I SAM-dependent methyltransferase [Desulfonauticus sp.]|nr:class I SAM-dependent methyltransferase [Desulfonauticus sp.]
MAFYDFLAKKAFESKKIADYYGKLDFLFKPEDTILNEFKDKLKNMRMLDIGVGGGRTTSFFSKYAKEYIGADYSSSMIELCKKRFPELKDNFFVCDARNLDIFQDNYFDFVLFSFNGIDNIFIHEERMKVLKEVKRVCKKGGYFCFSVHNLLAIDNLLKIKPSNNPVKIIKRKLKSYLIKILNEDFSKLKQKRYTNIIDGEHDFKLKVYYVRPDEQIKQLKETGFSNIRAFSWDSGKEIQDISKINDIKDLFIYFLCEA